MTTVHCTYLDDCPYTNKDTGVCSRPDILIGPGGICVNAAKENVAHHVAINDIRIERARQDEKWGEQNHFPQFWTGILGEEYGEFCEAVNETVFDNGEGRTKGGYENMRKEAIHVAAVALGFIECLERNRAEWFTEMEGGTK